MAKYIIKYRYQMQGKQNVTNFAGFIERNDEEATKMFGGPFIDYGTSMNAAKVFDSWQDAYDVVQQLTKREDRGGSHLIEEIK